MREQASPNDVLERAHKAIVAQDLVGARALLAPLIDQGKDGVETFYLARVEFAEGNLAACRDLLERCVKKFPNHLGAWALQARLHRVEGDLESADKIVDRVLTARPDHALALRIKDELRSDRHALRAKELVSVIDAQFEAARKEGTSDDLCAAADELSQIEPRADWNNDVLQAKIAYFHHATDLKAALRNYDSHLIEISVEFDYITWPKRIQDFVKGRSVLDMGCGFGGYGMGFLVAGAVNYVGADPDMQLDTGRARNKRIRDWVDMGTTPLEIEAALPAVQLFSCNAEDIPVQMTFDTVTLHNVTEHLEYPDAVFEKIVEMCGPNSDVVFLHHNFFCWNGHHRSPVDAHQLDLSDPEQREVYDWRHIDIRHRLHENPDFEIYLNQIRLDEMREVADRHLDVEVWTEIPSPKGTLERLTPEILDRVRQHIPDLTERDLRIRTVFCTAKPKA